MKPPTDLPIDAPPLPSSEAPDAPPGAWSGADDSALRPVLDHERRSWWSITLVMTAIGIDLSGLFLGLALAKGLTLAAAISAVLLGSALLGLLGIVCALVGSRTGLSSAMIATHTFGREGARLTALVMGLSLVGWFAVQAGFLGTNLSSALGLLGVHVAPPVLSAVGGVLMTLTALYGFRSMEKLSRFAVPLLACLIGLALVMQLRRSGMSVEAPVSEPMRFLDAVGFVIGTFIAGISTFPDLSRYARSNKDAVVGAFLGILIGNSVTLVIAVVLAKFTGEADVVRLFNSLHLGAFAVVVLVLAPWTINASNLFSTSLALSVVGRGLRFSQASYAVAAGLLGTVLAVLGVADAFLGFLMVLSMLLAPIGGAYAGRYFVVLRGRLPPAPKGIVPSTFVAWAGGALCAWATTPHEPAANLYGLGWGSLSGVPALDAFVLAFAIASLPALRHRNPA